MRLNYTNIMSNQQGRVHGGGGRGGSPPLSNFKGGGLPPPSFSINSLAKQTALKLNPIQDPIKFNSFKINKRN